VVEPLSSKGEAQYHQKKKKKRQAPFLPLFPKQHSVSIYISILADILSHLEVI
jgi:hypothetical protein